MTMPRPPWQDVRALPQRLIERLSPKQRQYAMLCTLMAGGVGLLWSIFAFTDNGQKIGVVPSSAGQPPAVTNIGVMPPGAQVNPVDQWVGTAGRKLAQPVVREQMEIFIGAARGRAEALDHTLIFGPPGLGKTTLANIIAREMGGNLKSTSGPVLERAGDLAAMLTNLEEGDVLFIDEIHRLSPVIEEILYPAMEDYQLDIMIGEGPAARSIKLDLPPFTLVAATTRAGLLTSPLRDRFGIVQRLEFYSVADLTHIVARSANLMDVPITDEGSREVARRSRGTPRIANRLLRRVRDYAQVKGTGEVNQDMAQRALNMLNVDKDGLDTLDRRYLSMLLERFDGGPAGVEALAAAMAEDSGTLEDVIEPYLIQQGYVMRTARGRIATNMAYLQFGMTPPEPK